MTWCLGFTNEADARRVLAVLGKRLGKYGLTLHPEKTRLVDFRRPRGVGASSPAVSVGSGTFDLLGFTHYWARSRKGHWVIKQKMAKDRVGRVLTRIGEWCRRHRHTPVSEQHRALSQQLHGHYGYYGITGNSRALGRVLSEVKRRWRYWLNRRSDRGGWTWERFRRYLGTHPLPPPVPTHSTYRLAATP